MTTTITGRSVAAACLPLFDLPVGTTGAVRVLRFRAQTARSDVATGASRHLDQVLAHEVHDEQEAHEQELQSIKHTHARQKKKQVRVLVRTIDAQLVEFGRVDQRTVAIATASTRQRAYVKRVRDDVSKGGFQEADWPLLDVLPIGVVGHEGQVRLLVG